MKWARMRQNAVPILESYGVDLVLCGHVHQSPFADGGGWADRIGSTWVVNSGREPGRVAGRSGGGGPGVVRPGSGWTSCGGSPRSRVARCGWTPRRQAAPGYGSCWVRRRPRPPSRSRRRSWPSRWWSGVVGRPWWGGVVGWRGGVAWSHTGSVPGTWRPDVAHELERVCGVATWCVPAFVACRLAVWCWHTCSVLGTRRRDPAHELERVCSVQNMCAPARCCVWRRGRVRRREHVCQVAGGGRG